MAKFAHITPPAALADLGPEVAQYFADLHEMVVGFGDDPTGTLDANNLAIEDRTTTLQDGSSPILTARASDGALVAGAPTVESLGSSSASAGLVLATGGSVSVGNFPTDEQSPYVDHDAALNFEAEEHVPLDDAATDVDHVWSAAQIIAYVAPGGGGGGSFAPIGAQYVTLADDPTLTADKVLSLADASAVGAGEASIIKSLIDAAIKLKKIKAGSGISLTVNSDDVTIAATNGFVIEFLSSATFNGVKTNFVGAFSGVPDVTYNSVIVAHSGAGVLNVVLGAPSAGECRVSGQDLDLGFAPEVGDWVLLAYVIASDTGITTSASVPFILTDTAWGTYSAGQPIFALDSMPFAATLPANASGSNFAIDAIGAAPADGDAAWHIYHNGSEVITVTVTQTTGVCTITTAPGTDTAIAAGDSLRIEGPNPADSAMSGFHWMLVMTRS